MAERLSAAGLHPQYLDVRRLVDLPGFVRLVRRLRACEVDVVHAHLGYSATLVPLAARLAGRPCVATLHVAPGQEGTRKDAVKEWLSVRVPALIGRVIFVSQDARDGFERRYGPAGRSWLVVPNGVDVDRFAVGGHQIRRETGTWACVAALRAPKGHMDLLRAWSQVVSEHPHIRLLIVGDGPERAGLERAAQSAGLGSNVMFTGEVPDVSGLLRDVDGVVSASLTEALPTALIEAAAAGLPAVATDAGGTREVVLDGRTGLLVPPERPTELARAVISLVEDPVRRRGMGRAAELHARLNFSIDAWISRLNEIYSEVVAERHSAQRLVTTHR